MAERSFSLRVITTKDKPEVIDFLSRFFFRDEPLNIETGMDLDYINGEPFRILEQIMLDHLQSDESFINFNLIGPYKKTFGNQFLI